LPPEIGNAVHHQGGGNGKSAVVVPTAVHRWRRLPATSPSPSTAGAGPGGFAPEANLGVGEGVGNEMLLSQPTDLSTAVALERRE